MAGELTNRVREIKQALIDLQNAGKTTTANMQEVVAFLDKLGSGQVISGLDYLTKGLKNLNTALKQLGAEDKLGNLDKLNAHLLQVAQSTRVLAAEDRALRGIKRHGQWVGETAESASNKWLYRNVSNFKNEQEAYLEYVKKLRNLQSIQEAREYTAAGKSVPMKQLIDPELPRVNEEFFKGLGFSSDATDRLRKKLEALGFSSANVTRNTTEASTGITQLGFKVQQASGNVRTFHATLDRAGNILDDTQKRFRTFGSAIVRDTVEVLKWSIAIGLVYAPMRKMSELLQQMTIIQASLADVQVALGKSTTQLGAVFEASAAIADETSSSIEGVIDGYREAYSASGSVTNQFERVATANILLRDSMVLSKLAGIDQSAALDTLVGALRQSGRELYQGQQLLDGWVAVSKNANVSLNQLASTFAIAGTAAEDVGITVDQLNGIVGTLAEATKLSADETGNAIRGFISGFQSAKAEETLARFGISVRTTSGEVRSFVDLMQELAVLSQSGVLSEREVAEITNVIGGGFRRGAQLAALLENFNRTMALTEISLNANGDAADALDIKMSTLDSAIVRLGNSFTALAQALGGEGGVLGFFTQMVNLATKVTQSITGLVNVLEGAAPILASLGVLAAVGRTGTGFSYLSRSLPTALTYLVAQNLNQQQGQAIVGPPGKGMFGGMPLVSPTGDIMRPTWLDLGRSINESVTKQLSKIPLVGGRLSPLGAAGMIVPGTLVGTQVASGQYEKAGVTFGASVLSALASGGSPIWTSAGALIATAFYDKFLKFEPNFAQRWAEIIIEAQRQAGQGAGTAGGREGTIADLEQDVLKTLDIGERFGINVRTFFLNAANDLRGFLNRKIGAEAYPASTEALTNIDLLTQAFVKQRAGEGVPGGIEGLFLYGGFGAKEGEPILDENTYNAIQKLFNEFMVEQIEKGIAQTATQKAVISTQERVSSVAATAAEDLITEALENISKGVKGSVEQYIDASRIQTALSLSASQLLVAIGTAQKAFPSTSLQAPLPAQAVGFVAGLTQEEARVLTQLTGEITTNWEKIQALSAKGLLNKEDEALLGKYNEDLETAVKNLEDLLPALQQATDLREAEMKIKPIIDLPDKLSGAQQMELIQNAERYWRYILEKQGLTDDEITAYINKEQEKLIRADKEILNYRTKAPSEMVGTVAEMMGLTGKDQFQFLDLRDQLGIGQIDQVLNRYQQISTAFKTNVPGFELELDPVTLILQEGFKNMDLDMRLFNLAMQELIDIEKEKMVEGMFNLPSGATFFVPFEPASLDARSRANQGMQTLNPESLFAQYPPDPNAFEEPIKQGAYEGVLAGMQDSQMPKLGEEVTGVFKLLERGPEGPPAPGPTYAPGTPHAAPTYSTPVPQEENIITLLQKLTAGTITSDQFKEGIAKEIKDGIMSIPNLILKGIQSLPTLAPITPVFPNAQPLEKGDISTMLNLQVTSTSNLVLDGQQIGQAVQAYLEQSMLKYDDTAGSINKVIAI